MTRNCVRVQAVGGGQAIDAHARPGGDRGQRVPGLDDVGGRAARARGVAHGHDRCRQAPAEPDRCSTVPRAGTRSGSRPLAAASDVDAHARPRGDRGQRVAGLDHVGARRARARRNGRARAGVVRVEVAVARGGRAGPRSRSTAGPRSPPAGGSGWSSRRAAALSARARWRRPARRRSGRPRRRSRTAISPGATTWTK